MIFLPYPTIPQSDEARGYTLCISTLLPQQEIYHLYINTYGQLVMAESEEMHIGYRYTTERISNFSWSCLKEPPFLWLKFQSHLEEEDTGCYCCIQVLHLSRSKGEVVPLLSDKLLCWLLGVFKSG